MPTATADTVKVTGLAERLVDTAKAFRPEYRSELLCAPRRPARGYLSIWKLTQHRGMVEPSLDPCGGTLSRRRARETVTRSARSSAESSLAEALAATVCRRPCRLSVPSRGSGDNHTTTWCLASLTMLKSPRYGRPDAWTGSDACSPGSPLHGRASERGIGFSINGSAERHATWIRRRP